MAKAKVKGSDWLITVIAIVLAIIIVLDFQYEIVLAEQYKNATDIESIEDVKNGYYYNIKGLHIEDAAFYKEVDGNQVILSYLYYLPVSIDINGETYYTYCALGQSFKDSYIKKRYDIEDKTMKAVTSQRAKKPFEEWCKENKVDKEHILDFYLM